uniref:Uncharacterized protein n=1 Tax=Opuntia streptacantha TaxID=393608 RepID=A0A7C8YD50_OPUST
MKIQSSIETVYGEYCFRHTWRPFLETKYSLRCSLRLKVYPITKFWPQNEILLIFSSRAALLNSSQSRADQRESGVEGGRSCHCKASACSVANGWVVSGI